MTASPAPTIIPITRFASWLDSQPVLKRCQVIGVTHSKNVNSKVLHEYLHIILRSENTGKWIRILVERQKEQDQVIIGFWPWVVEQQVSAVSSGSSSGSSGPSNKTPLPLLMRHTYFRPSLTLDYVTRAFVYVHNKAPDYTLFKYNCFWYSNAVYMLLRGKRPSTIQWKWIGWRKHFAVMPWTKSAMRKAADKFKNQMINTPVTGDPDAIEFKTLEDIVKEVIREKDDAEENTEDTQLKEIDQLDAAEIEALNAFIKQGEELDHGTVPEESDSKEHPAIQFEVWEDNTLLRIMELLQLDKLENLDVIKTRENFEEVIHDMREFTRVMFALDEAQKKLNLEEYKTNAGDDEPQNNENTNPFIERLENTLKGISAGLAPTSQEEADYQEALCIFVGGAFKELHKDAA